MDNKMYAQLDENNICTCVSTYKTDLEATYENFGQRWTYIEEQTIEETVKNIDPETGEEKDEIIKSVIPAYYEWQDVPKPVQPKQPTNAEVAQMISDLQADLIIAGVI